ncbi:hypothetical protein [Streptomonospora salina]|uniref:Uncharacterized protein n=1 Tax=Streptomonospora salina TaxID=104205 RepID=A0A841EBR4_9ACTN|nr:hypothetical protein [Streptomonospora salina]MBB5998458.1 hypothetical protein [Streptomonospora salina]
MTPEKFSVESLHRLRTEYPGWDIRFHSAPHTPDAGLFVASLVPAPGLLKGLLTTAAPTEEELRRKLEVHDRVARAIADAASAALGEPAEVPEVVVQLRRRHPLWRIRYEAGLGGGGRFVATRVLTAELVVLGLLEAVVADDATDLAHRLAYQDALTLGAAALTDAPTLACADEPTAVADLVAGCEELLRRAAGSL